MLNLTLFMKLVKQLIAAALIGSNGEKHTKSSYTTTLIEKLQIKSCLRNQPRYTVLPFIMLGPVTILQWKHWNNCMFFEHPSPLHSLFRLTLWVSIFSLQRGYWRKWAWCHGDTQGAWVLACAWLWHMLSTTLMGLNKAKVLLQTLLNRSSFKYVLKE